MFYHLYIDNKVKNIDEFINLFNNTNNDEYLTIKKLLYIFNEGKYNDILKKLQCYYYLYILNNGNIMNIKYIKNDYEFYFYVVIDLFYLRKVDTLFNHSIFINSNQV